MEQAELPVEILAMTETLCQMFSSLEDVARESGLSIETVRPYFDAAQNLASKN
jgi:hypothetical protein